MSRHLAVQNPYDELLERILENPDSPPTIVINSRQHYDAVRAGLSRAKKKLERVRSFLGEESLGVYQFKYTENKDDPSLVTISLVKPTTYPIEYVLIE